MSEADIIKDLINKNERLIHKSKEQEKMIDLMIKATKGRWDICKDVTKCKICKNGVFDTNYCEDCLTNYLKNEVKASE